MYNSCPTGYVNNIVFFKFYFYFIEKLRQLTHVVGNLSHKGIARRALPASGGNIVVLAISRFGFLAIRIT